MQNKFTFVRHGETDWSKNGIMHGQYDIPLNDTGHQQAESISRQFAPEEFDVCYCSPLSRAVVTAEVILRNQKKARLILDDRLKELYKGALEGCHVSRDSSYGEEKEKWMSSNGAESKVDFYRRVAECLKEVDTDNVGKKILVVSHCGTMRMANFFFRPPEKSVTESYYDLKFENCKPYNFT